MRSGTQILVGFLLFLPHLSVAWAQSSDAAANAYYDKHISPHFEAYVRCGLTHFRELGRSETRGFEDVEISVARPCGKHISDVRRAMAAGGMTQRIAQNETIDSFYRGAVPMFRKAFEASQKIEVATTRQRELQDAWQGCLIDFASETSVANDEAASVIVRGAFAYCLKQENALYRHLTVSGGYLADFMRDDVFPEIKRHYEGQVIAVILKLRAMPDEPVAPPAKLPGQPL